LELIGYFVAFVYFLFGVLLIAYAFKKAKKKKKEELYLVKKDDD